MTTGERYELEPLPALFGTLPDAQTLKRQVLAAIDGGYNDLVRARGSVTRPEDTYEVQRRLATAEDQLKAFQDAFAAGRKSIKEYQRDEFEQALGDREVQPRESMIVPDRDGDLRVAADTTNEYLFDLNAIVGSALRVSMELRDPGSCPLSGGRGSFADVVRDVVNGDSEVDPADLEEVLAEYAAEVVHTVLECGKFEPQVTKTKAYADALARAGEDDLAATVNSAIKKTVKLKGVKVERKDPK